MCVHTCVCVCVCTVKCSDVGGGGLYELYLNVCVGAGQSEREVCERVSVCK